MKNLRQIWIGVALMVAAHSLVAGADQKEQRSLAARDKSLTNSPPLPPPGRLIDLGGWRLHLNGMGARHGSGPTVILEAGAGDFSVDWSLVQPGVAAFARVCSYDRAGSGWSDLGPRPRTMHQIAYELHTLLEKAGERPPYVLVGHSYGGALVRVYQSIYPGEVAGMVLIEALTDNPLRLAPNGNQAVRASELPAQKPIPAVKTSGPLRESDIPPQIVQLIESQIPEFSAHANDPPRNKLPVEAQRMRTWSTAQLKMGISNDNPFELEELALMRKQRMATNHVLGNMPLIVLSRGVPEDSTPAGLEAQAEHNREQESLVVLSSTGKQVIARQSGHHVPIEQPELVISCIRDIAAASAPQRSKSNANGAR